MRIAISGMSGFVGTAMKVYFTKKGHEVVGVRVRIDTPQAELTQALDGCDALINLSGANILEPWTEAYKERLYSSRIDTTRKLVDAIGACERPPKVLLSASAVGIYDSLHEHTERSEHLADDFLGSLCKAWETEAFKAGEHGLRVAVMRFGVIFGKGGGAMFKMATPFKLGVGGKLGSGKQKVSWIHIDDLVAAADFILGHETLQGVFNLCAPEVPTNIELTKSLAAVLHRPAFFTVPAWLIRLIFGEGATIVLDSKEVYPKALQTAGFAFRHPALQEAFEDILA